MKTHLLRDVKKKFGEKIWIKREAPSNRLKEEGFWIRMHPISRPPIDLYPNR
jgi:hypothetical protein